jgi:hypothetical protein
MKFGMNAAPMGGSHPDQILILASVPELYVPFETPTVVMVNEFAFTTVTE